MAAQSHGASAPIRRDYRPEVTPYPRRALPFIRPGRHRGSAWCVPPTEDYALACEIGRHYAAHFAQYLKDNPAFVASNALGWIVADMDFRDESGAKGYWVGFFSHLERLIHAAVHDVDVFADLERVNAFYAGIAAARDREAESEENHHV